MVNLIRGFKRFCLVLVIFMVSQTFCNIGGFHFVATTEAVEVLQHNQFFAMPPVDELRASPKKVFAHYFPPFPISIDNKLADIDYYTKGYLDPNGESGKHKAYGGYLRERPLPRPTIAATDWKVQDMKEEVKRAIAIGLDGFTLNIITTSGKQIETCDALFAGAEAVDPGFKIVLMPDMVGLQTFDNVKTVIMRYMDKKSVYKLADGRLLVAPYYAQKKTAAEWKSFLESMKSEGVDIALLPLFQGWQTYADSFKSISYGYSDWGERFPSGADRFKAAPAKAHNYVSLWMHPIAAQDFRPKSGGFFEAVNSTTFRKSWEAAIQGGADWAQFITWNDYSEATELSPSSGTQFSFYDLAAYYITWFKKGTPPAITKDSIYYFHRIQHTTDEFDVTQQTIGRFLNLRSSSQPDSNLVEALAVLKSPGTVTITQGTSVVSSAVPAGITSVAAPLQHGKPFFELLRDGTPIINGTSRFEVQSSVIYQDMLYRGGCLINLEVAPTPTSTPTNKPTATPASTASPTPTGLSTNYKVSGFLNPDFTFLPTASGTLKSGFKVEVIGTQFTAVSDDNGYFEISRIPAKTSTYALKITKSGYLSREIENIIVSKDTQISTQTVPIAMWAGDMNGDNVINMSDIMEIAQGFNTVLGSSQYNPAFDVDKDNVVSMTDIMIPAKNFNKTLFDYPTI